MLKEICVGVLLLGLSGVLVGQSTPQGLATTAPKKPDILRKFPLTKFYDTPTPLPAGKPGDLIRSAPFEQYALSSGVEAVRILYYSRSGSGELVAASGVVLFPDGKPPTGGWPVIAWAHNLSGVARSCAPSLARNLLHGPFLSMYVNLGYAVVATDYTGLGTNFRNAFADAQSNALDVMYSVPAARSAVPGLGPRWIAMGTGEGAMAVVSAAELEHQNPDANYLGSVAISRVTDLDDLFAPTGNESHELPLLLAYGVKTAFPKFEAKDILTNLALPLYAQVGDACGVPDAEKVPVAGMLKAQWESNKFVQGYFGRNRLGMVPANGPLLVIGSEGDSLIIATTKVVARLCRQGDRVLFNRYAEYDPGKVIGDSARDQISWIQDRFAGRVPRSNCSAQP
ncbi:MAG: lipase family protein [Terriglobales bacterium]